jgi:hypothetical protein
MKVGARFKCLFLFFLDVPFLGFGSLFCSHVLVLLDGFLLLSCKFLDVLLFEFFIHAIVKSPWSFEVLILRVAHALPFQLVFLSYLFLWFLGNWVFNC